MKLRVPTGRVPALRYLLLLLLLLPSPCLAMSLAAWDMKAPAPAVFLEVMEAHATSYRELPGEPPPDITAFVIYLFLLVVYAALLTSSLPRARAYAARAARAISRTRATIARRPFER